MTKHEDVLASHEHAECTDFNLVNRAIDLEMGSAGPDSDFGAVSVSVVWAASAFDEFDVALVVSIFVSASALDVVSGL